MSARCPHCNARLSWLSLKRGFRCPSCGSDLAARTFWPWLATIGLWSLADIPLRMAMPLAEGTAAFLGVAVRASASLGIGYAIACVVVGTFSTVSMANTAYERTES